MDVLEHRNSADVGSGLTRNSLRLGICELSNTGDTQSCGSPGQAGPLGLDVTPERLESERTEGQAGPLELFHPGEGTEERDPSVVVADALRCQVKIRTRRSLHLRIANHTARDVYVRLVRRGGHIAGTGTIH